MKNIYKFNSRETKKLLVAIKDISWEGHNIDISIVGQNSTNNRAKALRIYWNDGVLNYKNVTLP